nr:EOG090X07LH [Eulimnadia texana]
MELNCAVQKYAWGKIGLSSLVAQLASANDPQIPIEKEAPYAELWMGTHPSGPSVVKKLGVRLLDYIREDSGKLGEKERENFGEDLPFLFKALSVQKALSIQAHPNKKHAEELHKNRPDLYKDPNHKPEMVIPWLGPFEALCGFRPLTEIQGFLQDIPELVQVIGSSNADKLQSAPDLDKQQAALKDCFTALMSSPVESVQPSLEAFQKRLVSLDNEKKEKLLADLFLRISKDFPGDVGCWCIYFMNYCILQPGESMFLGPNIPHAYISGDCLECMACSDNVVRAGLTPKFKDIDTLCSMLDYQMGPVDRFKLAWESEDGITEVCKPPVPDFALARTALKASQGNYSLKPRSSASILLVLQGKAEVSEVGPSSFGSIFFLEANAGATVKTTSEEDLIIYQAFSNV